MLTVGIVVAKSAVHDHIIPTVSIDKCLDFGKMSGFQKAKFPPCPNTKTLCLMTIVYLTTSTHY